MRVSLLLMFLVFCACGNHDADPMEPVQLNKEPSVPTFKYPKNNSLCLESQIDFEWTASVDPEGDPIKYLIQLSLFPNFERVDRSKVISETKTTFSPIEGKVYYAKVLARDSKGNESEYSPMISFYVEGRAEENHVPFSAVPVFPEDDQDITDSNNTLQLEWKSEDIDGDSLSFDLLFGEKNELVIVAEGLKVPMYETSVEKGKSYYWRVDTYDSSGKSIGAIWSFHVK